MLPKLSGKIHMTKRKGAHGSEEIEIRMPEVKEPAPWVPPKMEPVRFLRIVARADAYLADRIFAILDGVEIDRATCALNMVEQAIIGQGHSSVSFVAPAPAKKRAK